MEAITEFITALSSLAWPVLAGLVIYKISPSVKTILEGRSFSVRYGDAELSVQDASDQLRKQVEDLQNQVAKLIGGHDSHISRESIESVSGKLILWVDDKPKNNAYEIAKFQDEGYRVKTAKSTSDALQIINEGFTPDVVISDMGRNENGSYIKDAGIALIKELRDIGITSPIFIYTSQRYAQIHHDQALLSGGNGATASPVALYTMVNNG